MKFPLHLLLASAAPLLSATFSSAYLSAPTITPSTLFHRRQRPSSSSTALHYKEPSSKNNKSDDDGSDNHANVWSVLASTERWISDTLERSNKAANARLDAAEEQKRQQAQQEEKKKDKKKLHFADEKEQPESSSTLPRSDNPYARKEVSYVCETGNELSAVVGGVFRRVREARELGEGHGRSVEARSGDNYRPTTMRQTNVVVIPNCDEIAKFHTFDKLVQAINQARRASRDFVIKKKGGDDVDAGKDWVVSINCAHLHPQYGMPSPEEQLRSLKHEEAEGEVDLNYAEFKRRRDEARRSPYPSVIVEVQSTPPPDFGERNAARRRRDEAALEAAVEMETQAKRDADSDVTSEDVRKLEALFGMSAAKKSGSVDDPFYDALGEAFGDKVLTSQTPLSRAQDWVLQNDPAFDERTTFTSSNTRHVDAAYEYVFNNLSMLDAEYGKSAQRGRKSYVVLPEFLPTSATSFDRFAGQVSNIIRAMPGMAGRVAVSTFHPEHVSAGTRAPVPIVVITWK